MKFENRRVKTLRQDASPEPWPDYGQDDWDVDEEEIQDPPTTHLVAVTPSMRLYLPRVEAQLRGIIALKAYVASEVIFTQPM